MEDLTKESADEELRNFVGSGNFNCVKTCVRKLGLGFCEALKRGAVLLEIALESGYTDIAKYLLSKCSKQDIATSIDFIRPMRIAAQKNNFKFVKLMIQAGAPLNVIWETPIGSGKTTKTTPLCENVINKRVGIVQLFLENGADPNLLMGNGTLPLHHAIFKGSKCLVELLLKHGASINARNARGETAITKCIEWGRFKRLRYFLESHPERPDKNQRKLAEVMGYNILEKNGVINQLIKYGITIFPGDVDNVIFRAIRKGNIDVVREQLKSKGGGNQQFLKLLSYLHVAVFYGRRDIARILIEDGATISPVDNGFASCINYILRKRDFKMMKVFSEMSRVLEQDYTVLTTLISGSDPELIQVYLEGDIDRNAISTAFLEAVSSKKLQFARILLMHNADVDASDSFDQQTALHTFAGENNYEGVHQLLRSGASVFVKDEDLQTPLHIACQRNHPKIVKLLLEYGADPNVDTDVYELPLDLALENRDAESVKWLLYYGADLSLTNDSLDTVFTEHASNYLERNRIPTPVDGIFPIILHLKKQLAASIHVAPENLAVLKNDIFSASVRYFSENLESECKAEIKIMKTTLVPNSRMTFYDVLTASEERLVQEAANANFVEALCCVCVHCRKKFVPVHYEDMITGRIEVAKIRRRFLQKAHNDLLTVYPKLPNKCIESILQHLTNEDCHSLRKAVYCL